MTYLDKIQGPGCGCDAYDQGKKLVSIDQAFLAINQTVSAVKEEEILPLAKAHGRVLSQPVLARGMTPPFDNSAMDGYAVRAADFQGEGPWHMPVVARITAGSTLDPEIALQGAAVRIFTGAPVPASCDAVIMQEAVAREGDTISLRSRPTPGSHIRKAGEDMRTGAEILPVGTLLGAREIAACAAAGQGEVSVTRKIRVAFVSSGDELKQPGTDLTGSEIWDANLPMIQASLPELAQLDIKVSGARDDEDSLEAKLSDYLAQADLVITTGGISVGEADLVKPTMQALGVAEIFSGVAIKPGKPVSLGRLDQAVWLGLPGNPLSAYVTWTLFGRDLLARRSGQSTVKSKRRHVVLAEEVQHRPGRCELRPARLSGFDGQGREIASTERATHSARLSGISEAEGLIFIPGDCEMIAAGGLAEFLPFDEY